MAMQCSSFKYRAEATDGPARYGMFETLHGSVKTPIFMPVGTNGTGRTVTPDIHKGLSTQILLSNTYNLHK